MEGRGYRWTLKTGGKLGNRPDGTPLPMIALPTFGDTSHIAIDRRCGFIRQTTRISATGADDRQLRQMLSKDNMASEAVGRYACRTQSNATWRAKNTQKQTESA